MDARPPISVLHLVGSAVDDFMADLSRLYAGACLAALTAPGRYDHHLAYVSPDGSWRFPADLGADALASAIAMPLDDALAYVKMLGVDVVVPQMFCLPGMTSYRAVFDLLGIAYLGNPPEVMANAANKATARAIVAAAGVAVPDGRLVGSGGASPLPLPVVVKPVDADNSAGVSLVHEPADYDAAVDLALAHGTAALVESYVPLGREVRCGTIVRDGEVTCLPLEEYAVDPAVKPIRGRDDKLDRTEGGDLFLVAKDASRAWIVPEDDPVTAVVWEAARRCHEALGCRHYGLFDFRIDAEGNPWFLEAGPYCSFAPTSVIAVMAAARGIEVTELFAIALAELDGERPRCSLTTS
ncbi:D-alanine--D-alanine ligase [Mycolicibacterium sp. 050158]|uniref:D-alanine--D-alanine ligase family protein n=1 Tax=Mycolicibacterium sp. 050158 TaxID=3090602 RepID=UPI00299F3BEE|nr:D-alanine--D-alanine ligase [Mycolicibacterium sp. 050158]MDX1891184.1 D-alanine--D-alanine ligase [Mycolicibacterium sp. 050158]